MRNLETFVCRPSTFSSFDHLIDLSKNLILETANKAKIHHTKCEDIVKNLIADLSQQNFSLLLDVIIITSSY